MRFEVKFSDFQPIPTVEREQGYRQGLKDGNYLPKIADKTIEVLNDDVLSSIPKYLLQDCANLKTVNAPNVKTVGQQALESTGVQEVGLPSCEEVGTGAFRFCKSLPRIDLPSCKLIGYNAFNQCSALEDVELDVVETISSNAFSNCMQLRKIVIRSVAVCTLGNSTAIPSNAVIYVPDNLVEQYKSATNWSKFADNIKPLSDLEQ